VERPYGVLPVHGPDPNQTLKKGLKINVKVSF
jgi:hypothetical protein